MQPHMADKCQRRASPHVAHAHPGLATPGSATAPSLHRALSPMSKVQPNTVGDGREEGRGRVEVEAGEGVGDGHAEPADACFDLVDHPQLIRRIRLISSGSTPARSAFTTGHCGATAAFRKHVNATRVSDPSTPSPPAPTPREHRDAAGPADKTAPRARSERASATAYATSAMDTGQNESFIGERSTGATVTTAANRP
jgi:hypothetical protein